MNNIISKLRAGKKLFAPGAQKPIYLLNFVTNSCNAACDHCFYWEELNTNKKMELSVEEHAKGSRAGVSVRVRVSVRVSVSRFLLKNVLKKTACIINRHNKYAHNRI